MSRLPHSATRMESPEFDLRSDRLPIRFSHKSDEINDFMDDIIYNAIDIIQDQARDSDLRTFFFNLMANKDYDNRDFEELIVTICGVIEIAVYEGKFRDVRDAVRAVTKDVVSVAIGYQAEVFPDLMSYVERSQERSIDRAIDLYDKYQRAIEIFNDDSRGSRSRGRDDRDNRDRDRGSRGGRDRDRDRNQSRPRNDKWERGAVRGGAHGSRRRRVDGDPTTGPNQSTRYNDDEIVTDNNESASNSSRDDRNDRDRGDRGRVRVQRIPGAARTSDIDDALERERDSNKKGDTVSDRRNEPSGKLEGNELPCILARNEADTWVPSIDFPHPLAFNRNQELYFDLDLEAAIVIPRIIDKETSVNFYDHASMAFGKLNKTLTRFDNGDVIGTTNKLHESLVNSKLVATENNVEVTYFKMKHFDELLISSSMKSAMASLSFKALTAEQTQRRADGTIETIDIATINMRSIEVIYVTPEEKQLLEELRGITTFTKLAEKLTSISKLLRPEVYLSVDTYLRNVANHMLRQYLSISKLRISSFSDTWLELFAHVTEKFGDGFRDAISVNQQNELGRVLSYSVEAMESALPNGATEHVDSFVLSTPTRLVRLNAPSHLLDLDMLPEVGSQIMVESNPFFHDLATMVMDKDTTNGRFIVQTSDMRVLELSKSWLSDTAMLVRVIQ